MEIMTNSNWVERRARKESMLHFHADSIWSEVRCAVQDACASYERHYPAASPALRVNCSLENGHRIVVTRMVLLQLTRPPQKTRKVVLSYEATARELHLAIDEGEGQKFRIDSDEERVFLPKILGVELTPDALSRMALESILFGPHENEPPVQHRTSRVSEI